jgi:transcriptional regulator with XRE-family HTH domain
MSSAILKTGLILMLYPTQQPTTVNTKDEPFFKDMGARIAQTRKERGITQVQLSSSLGIAQQTLAHYEGDRLRLPASLMPAVAAALEIPVESLFGQPHQARASNAKRGPASRLEQQVELISQLPRTKQRFVIDMLDTVLAQASR